MSAASRRRPLLPALALLSLTVGSLGGLVGCDHKPGEAECEEAADKFMKLLADYEGVEARGDSEEKMHDEFLKACIADGTTREVACILDATAFDDLKKCQK